MVTGSHTSLISRKDLLRRKGHILEKLNNYNYQRFFQNDFIWINANPFPTLVCVPPTSYDAATNVSALVASTDPVALDYWAANYILMQTAQLNGIDNLLTINPDNSQRLGLT